MHNVKEVSSQSPPKSHIWLGVSAGVVSVMMLVFLLPYTFGYGFSRVTLGASIWNLAWAFDDWTHILLVPLIVLWLVWRQRGALKSVPIKGHWFGAVVILGSLFLYWAGFRIDIQYAGFVSIQMFIGGVILWLGGWQVFRVIAFPWCFLFFAWPFLFLDSMLAFPLRMAMSELSYHFLNLIGMDTMRIGTAIVSAPNPAQGLTAGERFEVDIADPCSGIRSLFALTMVASLYGHLTMKKGWQVVVVAFSAIPLAVLGNFVRIMLLTFGVLALGTETAIGTLENPSAYHLGAGFAVFAVALLGMVGVASLTRKIPVWLGKDKESGNHNSDPRGKKEATSFEY